MTTNTGTGGPRRARLLDGEGVAEFIYGTVTGMVAVGGIQAGHDVSWLGAAEIIVLGAVAIWIAHAYSELVAHRVSAGRKLRTHDLLSVLGASWPIVFAGALLAVPLFGVALRLCSVDAALVASNGLGVAVLALVGFVAERSEDWPRRVMLAVLSAGLGLAVVAVELVVHH
jgi:hypothetical protein